MNRRDVLRFVALGLIASVPAVAFAQNFQMTPSVQAELDRQKKVIAGWAADPVIVGAVKSQNSAGPIAGMDNAKWKTTRRTDALVKQFQANAAARYLKAKADASSGVYNEAFLNAARGEKVAFIEKTTSYVHSGSAKFDVPFGTGQAWQGKPEFDESSQTYAVQISVPVLDGGTAIGALVVGVNLAHLEKMASK